MRSSISWTKNMMGGCGGRKGRLYDFGEFGSYRGSRKVRDWVRVVRSLVWWEFRRLVVFGARWKSSGMR